jgi:hypothetical protein
MAIRYSRRQLVKLITASALVPGIVRAKQKVSLISGVRLPNGKHASVGLSDDFEVEWMAQLPSRGHMAAYSPLTNHVAAFARRPNRFLVILDKDTGQLCYQLEAQRGRHFYGHGAFSLDGRFLLTTENDLETLEGVIGVYDATRRYVRVGEFPSHGDGPHDIRRLRGADLFVVANGGLQTHPNSGRTVLNLDSMQSNLSYLDINGRLVNQNRLDHSYCRASIRHLSVMTDNRVAFGMQWQGDRLASPALVGIDSRELGPSLLGQSHQGRLMHGYIGSVASHPKSDEVGFSSPRAGCVEIYSSQGRLIRRVTQDDVCGLAVTDNRWVASSGTGLVFDLFEPTHSVLQSFQFDNHLLAIS